MKPTQRSDLAWPKLLLVLAVISLAFQLYPSTWWWLLSVLDAREWSRLTWFVANLAIVLALVAVRAAPEIRTSFARRREEANSRLKRKERRQAILDRQARSSRRIR